MSGAGRPNCARRRFRRPGRARSGSRALFGAISRGTERLVHAGRVPPSEFERMRAPFMAGTFPFPVKYGYATVGRVEAGPAHLQGRNVFALHPHQTHFNLAAEAAIALPADVPPQRAVLAANMETALNAVWDGAPGPADRIAVVGGGVLGLLVAYLCARLPGARGDGRRHRSRRARGSPRALGARFARRGRGARRLRSRLPRQRDGGRAGDRAAARRRGGDRRRAELVRAGRCRGAARRGVPQPAAAARVEPGRQGRAVAPRALEPRTAAGGGARTACGRGASMCCSRRPSRSRTCRRACL